jgi:hypothetical protein
MSGRLKAVPQTKNTDPKNEKRNQFLPPLMTPLVEEPIAMSGW